MAKKNKRKSRNALSLTRQVSSIRGSFRPSLIVKRILEGRALARVKPFLPSLPSFDAAPSASNKTLSLGKRTRAKKKNNQRLKTQRLRSLDASDVIDLFDTTPPPEPLGVRGVSPRSARQARKKEREPRQESLKTREHNDNDPLNCKKRPDSKKARKGAGGSRDYVPWCK